MPTNTELELEITHELWGHDEVRRAVRNNFIVLRSIVHNALKELGTIDMEAFRDGFDVYELDPSSQDTLADSLRKALGKYAKPSDNVGNALDAAPHLIANRLRDILEHLKGDSDALEYAKALVEQLRSFNALLASIYETMLTNNQGTPRDEELPKPATRGRVKLLRLYMRLRAMRRSRKRRATEAREVPITEYLRNPQA